MTQTEQRGAQAAGVRILGFVVAMVLLAAGCSGNTASSVETTTPAPTALPAAAAEALDNYGAAVAAVDGAAMLNYVTDDFAFLSYGTETQEREFRAAYVTENYGNFSVETIGDRLVLGGGNTYIVSAPE